MAIIVLTLEDRTDVPPLSCMYLSSHKMSFEFSIGFSHHRLRPFHYCYRAPILILYSPPKLSPPLIDSLFLSFVDAPFSLPFD